MDPRLHGAAVVSHGRAATMENGFAVFCNGASLRRQRLLMLFVEIELHVKLILYCLLPKVK